MNLLRTLAGMEWLSEQRRLELYPPFFLMRAKFIELSNDWRHIRIRLPLTAFSRNMGGAMFGGWQAALADPVAALACVRVFPGYSVWTRAMAIDFMAPGDTHLELRFDMPADKEAAIHARLKKTGRATPQFEYGYYRSDGTCCTTIHNTVALRPKGYVKPNRHSVDLDGID